MDSHKAAIKRGIEVVSTQNQDDPMSSLSMEGEDGAQAKRFKQELHPLQMEAVLEQIFSNLGPKTIKSARQVNRLWSVEGAKILITKCYVKIPSAIHDGDFISRVRALEEFKAFLSHKSSSFSTISKITVNAVADVEVWKYLGVLEQVKSLKYNTIHNEDEDEFFKTLLDLLPNLNHLRYEGLGDDPRLTENLTKNYNVPNIIKALITVMSTPEKESNSLIISSLYLYLTNGEELEDMGKLASCKNISVEKLKINMDPEFFEEVQGRMIGASSILSNILSTSQNILTLLHLIDCHPILPLLEFPCMSSLTHIDLEFEVEGELSYCKFSPSFRFSEKVPNLQEVRISEPILDHPRFDNQNFCHCLKNLFETAGTAPSVKKVSCWGNASDFDVYHIFKTFPNIEFFVVDLSWQSEKILRSLWKQGRNLKELILFANCYAPLDRVDDLDASFTGLPVWTVEEIKKAPNLDTFTLEELENLRYDLSILNMKELQQLTIHFRGDWKDKQPKRMLAVAGQYAFKLLPKNPKIIIDNEKFKDSMDLIDVSKLSNVKIVS